MSAYPDRTIVILPEPYLIAIGKVSVQWGMLEMTMEMALHKLGHLDTEDWRTPVFTAHMSWPQRMDILRTLIDGLKSEFPNLAKFEKTVKPALVKAQRGRNRVAHAQWGYDAAASAATIMSLTARGKFKANIETVTVMDIESTADDIGLAAMLLWKLVVNKL